MKRTIEKFKYHLRLKEAAEFLGVSPNTVRNWRREGKLTTFRTPINGYRLRSNRIRVGKAEFITISSPRLEVG